MTRRLVRLSVLMALGLALHLVESAIALPVLLPGAKLGLANVATLLVLAEFDPNAAALFGPIRHLLAACVTGTFLLPTFWLGMGGSLAVSLALLGMGHRANLRTAGVLAGAAFQVGQGTALVAIAGSVAVLPYVPPLVALGVGAGWMTGLLADQVARILQPERPVRPDRSLPVLGALLAAALVFSFLLANPHAPGTPMRAHVFVAGKEVMALDLSEPQTVPLAASGGAMLIQTGPGGRARVLASDCPDQVCVLTGWISRPGETIVCAPYRVLVTLEGGESDLDGIVK